jgi:hypothetical protein
MDVHPAKSVQQMLAIIKGSRKEKELQEKKHKE